MARIRTIFKWLILLSLLGGGGGYAWQNQLHKKWFDPAAQTDPAAGKLKFVPARRGPMQIGLIEGGHLRALKNHSIRCKTRDSSKIAWVIAESTQVAKGQKVVEFESRTIQENIRTAEAELDAAERQLVVETENQKIEQSNGRSLVADAQTKLIAADEALKRFTQLDAPKRFREMEAAANTARKGIDDAFKALQDAQSKFDDEMDEDHRGELEKSITSARESLKVAQHQLATLATEQKLVKSYDYPRDLDAKRQALENADLDLTKAEVSARSSLLQKQAELGKAQDNVDRLKQRLKELSRDLEKCVVLSPVDGIILYGGGDNNNRWGGSVGREDVKVGASFYSGQTILTIPDLSAFEIDIAVGEEYRGKLQPGCKAVVTIEAIPGLVIDGLLKDISRLSQPRIAWDPSSPKVFTGAIQLANADPRMVSGMSARAEIVAEVLADVLMVPLECVFNEDGKPICYVRHSPDGNRCEKRFVSTAASNDDNVQITYGLSEGDQVALFRPGASEVIDSSLPPPPPPAAATTQPNAAGHSTTQPGSHRATTQPGRRAASQPHRAATRPGGGP